MSKVRAIAFYLPQFHPITENDRWWGKGFTEWTNVSKATPLFRGHYQPRLPGELGFYDLRVKEVRAAQAALAREHGIHGFCYYYYWFNGRRLLERPLNEVLESGEPDFPFCVCWANENWTRRWDGGDNEVLMKQEHSDENDAAFIRDLLPLFRDRRYIRVNDRPLLLVYRTELLPDPRRTADIWRQLCAQAGVGTPYLVRAESFHHCNPEEIGFDASYEFPPHGNPGAEVDPAEVFGSTTAAVAAGFQGKIQNYADWVRTMTTRAPAPYRRFRGVMTSWDNSARSRRSGLVVINSSPALYRRWLASAVSETCRGAAGDERLLFINAWNEWAEGCHLEPDRKFGRAYLMATQLALHDAAHSADGLLATQPPLESIADPELRAWVAQAAARITALDRTLEAAIAELRTLDQAPRGRAPQPRHALEPDALAPDALAPDALAPRADPIWRRDEYRSAVDAVYNLLKQRHPRALRVAVRLIKTAARAN